jgi:hypothetical protein
MSDAPDLVWRSVLATEGEGRGKYAEWVRDLSDRSGVYLIRSDPARFGDELLYIGESHTRESPGQKRTYRGLYRTLTRHFHGHNWTQGITYEPADVLVAVVITEPGQAVAYQDQLIAMYRPRDNEIVKQMRIDAWGIDPSDYGAWGPEDGEPFPDDDGYFDAGR